MTTNIVINSEPIKIEHVGWITRDITGTLILIEMVRKTYIHPDSQGMGTISQIEEDKYIRFDRRDNFKNSHVIQLEAALNTVSKIEGISQ